MSTISALNTKCRVTGSLAEGRWLIGRQRPLCGPSQRKADGGPEKKNSPRKKSGNKKKFKQKFKLLFAPVTATCTSKVRFLSINFGNDHTHWYFHIAFKRLEAAKDGFRDRSSEGHLHDHGGRSGAARVKTAASRSCWYVEPGKTLGFPIGHYSNII